MRAGSFSITSVLVLVVVTSVLGPILTERHGDRVVAAGHSGATGALTESRAMLACAEGEAKGRKPLAELLRERDRIKAKMPEMDSEVTI